MEMEREIDPIKKAGSCPFCNSKEYYREDIEPSDDYILVDCECSNCNKNFKETFVLRFQNWDGDDLK